MFSQRDRLGMNLTGKNATNNHRQFATIQHAFNVHAVDNMCDVVHGFISFS